MVSSNSETRDFRNIPYAIVLMGLAIIFELVPDGGFVTLILGLISVILVLVDRMMFNSREKAPLYASIIIFIITFIALAGLIFVFILSFATTHANSIQVSSAEIYQFVRGIIPIIIGGGVIFQFTYLLYPYGLANSREKIVLWSGTLISIATSTYVLMLIYVGNITLPSIPSTASAIYGATGITSALYAKLIQIPGIVILFLAYLFIGLRLHRRNSAARIRSY